MGLLGEELLQHGAHFGNVNRGDLPNDADVHICVVVGHNVAHSSHSPKRQLGNLAPGGFGQVGCGLADDFDAPDDGVLFLRIDVKASEGRVFYICCDEPRGLQYVVQAPSWSASIDADRCGENVFPGKAIRRIFKRGAQNKIHGYAH